MPHDTSVAMMERLGVCWRQTGAMVERTLHDHRKRPGPLFPLWPGLGNGRGWLRGEALQRSDGALAGGLQPLREWSGVQSGKPGGFCEGLWRGHDQQKQPSTGADPLKTVTDGDTTDDPRLQGARRQEASPLEPLDKESRVRARPSGKGSSTSCTRRHVCETRRSLPVIENRWGYAARHDARAVRGSATGRSRVALPSDERFSTLRLLSIHCL